MNQGKNSFVDHTKYIAIENEHNEQKFGSNLL